MCVPLLSRRVTYLRLHAALTALSIPKVRDVRLMGPAFWDPRLFTVCISGPRAGVFLFFIFLGLSVLVLQLLASISAIPLENARRHREAREGMARRLCHAKSGKPVEAPSVENGGYHIFLSHVVRLRTVRDQGTLLCHHFCPSLHAKARRLTVLVVVLCAFLSQWGSAQDQMRVIKQRLLEMIPDLSVFLEYACWRPTQELNRAAKDANASQENRVLFCSQC
jgi:hypothetical protein